MIALPPRYEAKWLLGQGGSGEVWAVRDRANGKMLALKVLAEGAGDGEVMALVREAMALSGLEGLGVPRVIGFGTIGTDGSASGPTLGARRYMLRELVEGHSLEEVLDDVAHGDWIAPLARASEQLTVLHRSGLLHGDVKPANVIVGADGAATLVDLGLAAPWREGGSIPKGLTPKYAAPELFQGAKLTVRAEVYALGATLADALERRGDSLPKKTKFAFHEIAERATSEEPTDRHPSVDEFASELRHAAGLASHAFANESAWPVIGVEKVAEQLRKEVSSLAPGEGLAIEGAARAGRTTLARRLAWSLGVEGRNVVLIEPLLKGSILTTREVLEMELPSPAPEGVIAIVDDADRLDDACRVAIARASEEGARLVIAASRAEAARFCSGKCRAFAIPAIDAAAAEDLVARAMPSLPKALVAHVVSEAEGRPGKLRAIVRLLAGKAIVAREDIDAALASRESGSLPPSSTSKTYDALTLAEKALDMGRIADAEAALSSLQPSTKSETRVRTAVARARMALGIGDSREAKTQLESVATEVAGTVNERAWLVTMARTHLRHGDYADASQFATRVVAGGDDAFTADALAVHGLSLAWTGRENEAEATLKHALEIALKSKDRRVEAVVRGSIAIVIQRAGRNAEAREAYEASLAAAEDARDATTVALTRLNLAGLARAEGDLALALTHLEAAVDMARRAGSTLAVQGALLNLANLDLYLGRYARARVSVDSLAEGRANLSPIQTATLLGLEAELAIRAGDTLRGAELFEESARKWDAQNRPLDAIEARLERILAMSRDAKTSTIDLVKSLTEVESNMQGVALGENEALAELVRGAIASAEGKEAVARAALDRSLDLAEKAGRREWSWLTLETRARLLAAQGSNALARRDVESALAILEDTAAKLPRDLREVFWNDPRRRALRQAHVATHAFVGTPHTIARSSNKIPRGKTTTIGAPMPAEDRLVRIFEITRELASERDLDRLLTRVTDHAIALTAAERGFILLAKADGKLEAHAARDRSGELASEAHAQFSQSVAAKVLQTGEPVITDSARSDERLNQAASVHKLMIQAIACVPIRSADPVAPIIGALYVETRGASGARFADEIPTLAAFADQAAIAIESARLIAENRARAEELARANVDLEAARAKLEENLGRRTEQLAVVRRDLKQVRTELRSHFGYGGLVGTSAAMRKMYAVIDRIKDTDVPVLISGESGVGKEVVARAVHASGPRAKKAFLGVNCGAIPENLLESELFGNVRGAFTGADKDRNGLFREADGGTLLLDEVGELPIKMQAALLRVLQERCVRPVGAAKEEPVDVRVVAATNRDLQKMVEEGTFREDLYYRLHVIELVVPPLRARLDDLPSLIDHFLGLFSARYRRERKSVARDAVRTLTSFDWPGNVRQLEHVLLNAWLMSEGNELTIDDFELPGAARAASIAPPPRAIEPPQKGGASARSRAEFKDAERERILTALAASNWNRVKAAKMIGLPRRTFYRRLKEFGIV
jgi:transcriptional regulator with GAF, ATPase, and Fis domain